MYIEKIFLENFKVSIFKKKKNIYIYIYNTTYFCLIKINSKIEFNIKSDKFMEIKLNNRINDLSVFLEQFYLYKYAKIKFTGKGYKIKKNTRNSIILLFNRAHTTTLWWKNVFLKKLKKYKIYIRYNHINANIINTIINVRPSNIFTKKGLRKSRQILLKKKGKK
jgi:hypothetical protein